MKIETREIVINSQYGGFSLSRAAFLELRKMGNKDALEEPDWEEKCPDDSPCRERDFSEKVGLFCRTIARDDSQLVEVVKKLGEEANGDFAKLSIIEIPANVKWELEDHVGKEQVREVSRTWF